jgi:hypothetical protein
MKGYPNPIRQLQQKEKASNLMNAFALTACPKPESNVREIQDRK